MRIVSLDPDGTIDGWLGVIVAAPTGVTYRQQCGGTACLQRSMEGYYVPVGGVAVGGQPAPLPGSEDLRQFFLDHVGVESPVEGPFAWRDPAAMTELQQMVAAIHWWSETESDDSRRHALEVDGDHWIDLVEAWVPVKLGVDGAGVLVWRNSD